MQEEPPVQPEPPVPPGPVVQTLVSLEDRKDELRGQLSEWKLGAFEAPSIGKTACLFDPNDPAIKADIARMIVQYLRDEGYTQSMGMLQDETNERLADANRQLGHIKRMKSAILEGNWLEVENLSKKQTFKQQKAFLFAVYKQAYLELVELGEFQKALSFLHRKLKPLEANASSPAEFKDLCYLLTCKSVDSVERFQTWDGAAGASREALVEQYEAFLEQDAATSDARTQVPPERLIVLLQQAVSHQVAANRYHPKVVPQVNTLLQDYKCFVLPNALKHTLSGHKGNVKAICFVGDEGLTLASGSSDNQLMIWSTETGECLHTFVGPKSRIWDVASCASGKLVASASGDGSVMVWNPESPNNRDACVAVLQGHQKDVYTVCWHPGQKHVVTGGYDTTVRLWDVRTREAVKVFSGHNASVSSVIFNPYGNLIISGSKDSTIQFYDIVSGLCIKSIRSHLGEVTSVQTNSTGTLLLSSSKDNSNRLWDTRTARPIMKFKGHQNTSKNFVRSDFGPGESLIIGGSEDGHIYVWDIKTGFILQKLKHCNTVVYGAVWNQQQALLASCAHDNTIKTWWFDEKVPLFHDDICPNSQGRVNTNR